MENIEEQKNDLWLREKYLTIMLVATRSLEWMKEKKELKEYIKHFGKEVKLLDKKQK